MRSRLAVVALVSILGACSGGDPGAVTTSPAVPAPTDPARTTTAPRVTTTIPAVTGPDWVLPALRFFETLRADVDAGSVEKATAFYRPDALFVDDLLGVQAQGWRRLGRVLRDIADDPVASIEPGGLLLLDMMGGAITVDRAVYGPASGCPVAECRAPEVQVFQIVDGRIAYQTRGYAASLFEGVPRAEERFGQMERLAAAAEEAWRTRDPARYDALVAPPPYGPENASEEMLAAIELFPRISVEALTMRDLGLADNDDPAVFSTDPLGEGRAQTGVALFRLGLEPGVSLVMANWWDLWDGLVVRGRSLYEPDGWDRIWEAVGADVSGDIWPATMEIPEPYEPERTHVVEVGGSTVDVYDGTDGIVDLLGWAMGRFELAGLDPPALRSLTLESDLTCTEGAGWASTDGAAADIRLCIEDAPDSMLSRFTLLHELGHAWTATRADGEALARFVDDRGLEAWWDPALPWQVRGIEHAAEILAWGLMDQPVKIIRVPDTACSRLAEGFEVLTGIPPIGTCAPDQPTGRGSPEPP